MTTAATSMVPSAFEGSRHYARAVAQAAERAITAARPPLPPIRFISGGIQQGGLGLGDTVGTHSSQASGTQQSSLALGTSVETHFAQAEASQDPSPRIDTLDANFSEDEEAARFLGLED